MDWTFFFSVLFCFNAPLLCAYWYWAKRNVSTPWQALIVSGVLVLGSFGLLGWGISDHYTGAGINAASFFHASLGLKGLQWQMAMPLAALMAMVALLVVLACGHLWHAARANSNSAAATETASRPLTAGAILSALLVLGSNPGYAQSGQVLAQAWEASRLVANVMEGAQLPATPPATYGKPPISAIYIYAEGLESAFLDDARFPGLMPELDALGKQGLRIHGIHQVTLTGWTIAGQTASNCGFPGSDGGAQFVSDAQRWPCATDLLAADGYALAYLNGSSLEFADKGTFWRNHGYQFTAGDADILKLAGTPDAPMSEWGAYDDTMFAAAWNEYRQLLQQRQDSGRPFVLTLLTVDTHAPKGMDTPTCRGMPLPAAAQQPFAHAVHCADHLIAGFIRRVLADKPDNLVVVLQSDHLQPPRNDMILALGAAAQRDNLWMAWGHGIEAQTLQRQATMFDAAPTFLGLLGRQPIALNLGRDLRGNAPTLAEQHGYPWIEQHMQAAMLDARLADAKFVEDTRADQLRRRLNGQRVDENSYGDPNLHRSRQ